MVTIMESLMDPKLAKYRPFPFVATLVAYVLPFMTMTCMGQQKTFSGFQVAFGTTVGDQTMDGNKLVLVALVLAVVGLILSFRSAIAAVLQAEIACGAVGAVLLLVAQSQIASAASGKGIALSFNSGYLLAILAFLGAVLFELMLLKLSPGGAQADVPAVPPPPLPPSA
jgi:hypothetical protein